MKKQKWNKGAPPSIGWWIASMAKNSHSIRWWNGENWSMVVHVDESAERAGERAMWPAHPYMDGKIEWQHRPEFWPARSFT